MGQSNLNEREMSQLLLTMYTKQSNILPCNKAHQKQISEHFGSTVLIHCCQFLSLLLNLLSLLEGLFFKGS